MGPDAKSLIERARRDGPSPAQREQMRRNVKAVLAAGLGVASAGTAAAAQVGAAGAVHGLGASLTPLGVLGWLGAGSAVSAVVLGAVVLATGTPTAERAQPGPAAAPAVTAMAAGRRAETRALGAVATSSEEPSTPPAPPSAGLHAKEPSVGAEDRAASGRSDSLRAEYALLEAAHRALEQGDTDAALLRLSEHQRQFGQGRLAQERQGIRVLALCMAERPGAHQQAAVFLRSYPRSLLGPRIRQQCHLE
ncbi:MAG: hypothetical protein JW940_29690 [Polyangiaceae bacterium]|nr:hypothetical protein [Polyangiaceae bacterium]